MTEMKANIHGKGGLAELIRNEIGSDTNRRFLSRMPAFRPVAELPRHLQTLLGDLNTAEAQAQGKRERR